jgi:hypothetical protein
MGSRQVDEHPEAGKSYAVIVDGEVENVVLCDDPAYAEERGWVLLDLHPTDGVRGRDWFVHNGCKVKAARDQKPGESIFYVPRDSLTYPRGIDDVEGMARMAVGREDSSLMNVQDDGETFNEALDLYLDNLDKSPGYEG